MINDPGIDYGGLLISSRNASAHSTQVKTRILTISGGSTGTFSRYFDIVSNGDNVPSTITTFVTSGAIAGSAQFYMPCLNTHTLRLTAFEIAVRANGVVYSDDLGVTWTRGTIPGTRASGGAYIPAWRKYIGFGLTPSPTFNIAQVFSSDNGADWTASTTYSLCSFYEVAYSPDKDIAVAPASNSPGKGIAFWTKNGTDFFPGTFSGTSFTTNTRILYQPRFGTFLLGREGTTTANCLAISSDGKNWDPITATGFTPIGTTNIVYGLAHNPITGRTVATIFSGASSTIPIRYSDNGGYNWTTVTIASSTWFLEGALYDPNTDLFVVTRRQGAGNVGYLLSSNGVNWTFYSQATPGMFPTAISVP